MSSLSTILSCSGQWHGQNTLQDPETGKPEESATTATVTPLLGDRFVRIDYTWSYRSAPQAGSLLLGYDNTTSTVSAYWIDSWHMGDKGMLCEGGVSEQGEISVRGSYAAPPGPDWGWRIVLTTADDLILRIVMYNIWPTGQEDLAVEAIYQRS